jgi:hypothetical protein
MHCLKRRELRKMVYRGHVENGTVIVDDAATLPDGVRVEIRVVSTQGAANAAEGRPWLRFSGIVDDLPANASQQIDQVLYGRLEE